tara:strand:+ start:215 stop:412 length:198 start_codon:yes stop_codon:yes gene_type:complete
MANVMIKYKVVHTGAKTQSGGLKFDFTSCEYHGSLKLIVTIPPINDAEYVIMKNRINDINLFFNI